MLRKILAGSLVLLLAGIGLDLGSGTVQARPHGGGGGHAGGGFHGGAHFGGSHFGGFNGGSHFGGFHGGIHSPVFHPGDRFNAGTHRFPATSFRGDRFRYWPAYGYTGPLYPYSNLGSWYSAGGGGSDEDAGQGSLDQPNNVSPANGYSPVQHNDPADILMTLPADATLWAQGYKTSSTGSIREFTSPPLETGGRYTYHFRANWKENGHTVTQRQDVVVTPGAHVRVHFPLPEKAHPAQTR